MRTLVLMLALLVAAPAGSRAQMAGMTAEQRLPVCLACHGANGASPTEGIPSLGAMPTDFLLIQLYLFREKQRVVAPMNAMTEGLSDDDLRILAEALTKLPPPPPGPALPAAEQEQGRALAQQYRCTSCHGADFSGHDQMPRLAGQREEYLVKALTEYKSNARPGYDPAMNEVSQELKAEHIGPLARYLSRFH